jgi:hypothetical protein
MAFVVVSNPPLYLLTLQSIYIQKCHEPFIQKPYTFLHAKLKSY